MKYMALQSHLVGADILRFWVATLGEVGTVFLAAGMSVRVRSRPGPWVLVEVEPLAWAGFDKAAWGTEVIWSKW